MIGFCRQSLADSVGIVVDIKRASDNDVFTLSNGTQFYTQDRFLGYVLDM